MAYHELKIAPQYLKEVIKGTKTFEVRKDDRGYRPGDVILLRGHDSELGYTGVSVRKCIGYVTNFKQRKGYVVFFAIVGVQGRKSYD